MREGHSTGAARRAPALCASEVVLESMHYVCKMRLVGSVCELVR